MAIRFTIDHFEPRMSRPDLENEYTNLMYACDECNTRKGDRCPPEAARADGHRFFRPDQDLHDQHFERSGVRLNAKTSVADYSIDALDLNRASLRRLREIRERVMKSDILATQGVLGLKNLRLDHLPPSMRGRATTAIKQADQTHQGLMNEINSLLMEYAHSPMIDPDTDSDRGERDRERIKRLKSKEALYPDNWRAPRRRNQRG
jgi:hypothetical protein